MKPITLDLDAFPTDLPLDFQLVKADLRIFGDELDDLISSQYIPSAIDYAEGVTRRNIASRAVRWVVDDFPRTLDQAIRLPRGDVSAISSIAYSVDGAVTTLTGPSSGSPAGTDYQEDLTGISAIIMPPRGDTWPASIDDDVPRPVVITYTAGYATADLVPANLRRALVAQIYVELDQKGLIPDGSGQPFDLDFVAKLLSPFRLP